MSSLKLPANYIALDDFGGLQTLYAGFAEAVTAKGHQVFTVNRANSPPLQHFSATLEQIGGSVQSPQTYRVANVLPGTRRLVQHTLLNWRFGSSNLDHVLCWNAPPDSYMKSKRRKFAFYDHGFSSIRKVNNWRQQQLARMNGIISVSESNKRLLKDLWHYEGKVHVVRNPLRQEIAKQSLKKKRNPEDNFRISCASRLVSFKGIVSVIHATALLVHRGYPVTLTIAGEGPEARILEDTARKLLPIDKVAFPGLVKDMCSFFEETDIFVAPSLREPFGLSPLEALASGVPTVLSNIDGHPETLPFVGAATLVEPELSLTEYAQLGSTNTKLPEYVYFPSQQLIAEPKALAPDTLADALSQVINSYTEHANTAFAAAEQVRRKFSIEKYTDELLEVLGEVF
ncbi:glycosyltransferase family 4 protein [Ruegeria atlantica]|uniref:glycosyltransferase family 4 protein n=1 Tax=Ruegeria atlantica TaxID=81569 RepID=UPI0014816DE0|nr:glycosyltransferase family 4 protein [Ruegeria atlantica]